MSQSSEGRGHEGQDAFTAEEVDDPLTKTGEDTPQKPFEEGGSQGGP